jgi:hypothetical protein
VTSVLVPADVSGADVVPPLPALILLVAPGDVFLEEVAGVAVLLAVADVLVLAAALDGALDEALDEGVDESEFALELGGHGVEVAGDGDLVASSDLVAETVGVVVPVALGLVVAVVPPPVGLGLPVGLLVVELPPVAGAGLVGELDELGELGGLDVVVVAFAAVDFVVLPVAVWAHDVSAAADVWLLAVLPGGATPPPEDTAKELWFSVLAPPVFDVLLLVVSPTETATAWRSGGRAAMKTPTVNTAMPTASAGRSIASRQSLGCFGARCVCPRARPGRASLPRSACQRPARAATSPQVARRDPTDGDSLAEA